MEPVKAEADTVPDRARDAPSNEVTEALQLPDESVTIGTTNPSEPEGRTPISVPETGGPKLAAGT